MDAADERVARAIDGDLEALESLVRDVEPGLKATLRIDSKWSRSFDVDDVVQVTFMEAFLRISSLERATMQAFSAWLKRIAQNNLIDAVRALESGRRPDESRRVTHGPAGESARTLLLRVSGGDSTAGGRAAIAEQIQCMHDAIAQMPRSYRHVIRLVDLEQKSFDEVADELGRSIGAVHMLRSRAHERLRELLHARLR